MYEQYLSEKASPRLKIDDSIVKRLLFKIRTEPPDSEWFAETQKAICTKIESEERFFEAFKMSLGYVKLLAELDLLRDPLKTEDDDNQSSIGDELSIYDSVSLSSFEDQDVVRGSVEDNLHHPGTDEVDTTITNEPDSGFSSQASSMRHRR